MGRQGALRERSGRRFQPGWRLSQAAPRQHRPRPTSFATANSARSTAAPCPQLVQGSSRARRGGSPRGCCAPFLRRLRAWQHLDHRPAAPCRATGAAPRAARASRRIQRHLPHAAGVDPREDPLVLAPGVAERLLPPDVGLDAVAVADVDHGRAPGRAAHAPTPAGPSRGPRQEHVERRLVELDHVDAVGLDLQRLGVQQLGEAPSPCRRGCRMTVGDGCRRWSSGGQRDLETVARVARMKRRRPRAPGACGATVRH